MANLTRRMVLAAAMAAPLTARAADQPASIRIAIPSQVGPTGKPEPGTATRYIDRVLQQDFNAPGPKIEWVLVPGAGPGINEAVAGGSVDFAYYGDFPSIIGRAGGLTTKLILAGKRGNNSYLLVPPDSAAKTILDLKGKRLAVNKGRPWNLAFSQLLTTNKLTERDFQVFNLSPGDAAAAMASGNVDAVYQPEPFGYTLEKTKIGKIIWSTRDLPLTYKFTLDLFVGDAFEQAHPDLTQKLVTSFVKSAHYASLPENRDEISQEHVTAGAPRDVIELEYKNIPWRDIIDPEVDAYVRAHYKDAVAYMAEQRLIRHGFDTEAWIESKYADAAIKTLGYEGYWPKANADGKPI